MSVYADNNSTTPVHPFVLHELCTNLARVYGNPSTSYPTGLEARAMIDDARDECRDLFKSPHVIFCSSASEANNLVIRSIVGTAGKCVPEKPHVLMSSIEHPSVYNTVQSLAEQDMCEYDTIPVDSNGIVNISKIPPLLRATTVLACIIRSNNETGVVQDIQAIASVLHDGIHLHVDATQCIGKVPFALEGDTAVVSAHKFRGPKGVAALLVKNLDSIHPICTGGKQEMGLRAGTESAPMIRALATAARISVSNTPPVIDEDGTTTLESLRDSIEGVLESLGCTIHCRNVPRIPNTISAMLPPMFSGRRVMDELIRRNICVNQGSACSKGGPSGTLRAMNLTPDEEARTIRISLGTQNTHDDVRIIIDTFTAILGR